MSDRTRAEEIEDLALRMSLPNRGVSEWRHEAIGALRSYAALLREDRCAPLVEALEAIARDDHTPRAWSVRVARDALRAHRYREGQGEDG